MKDALSSFGRTRRKIFFSFFLSLLLISFVAYSTSSTILSPVGGEDSPSFSPPSGGGIGSSEEENIDSFDVHPESGRWNTTLDDSIEDRVIDSQFEILTVQNETSGSSGYEMNRGTVKTDGKFEWRMKNDGSGNQTELFRDNLGDECDFTEDEDGFTLAGATASEGILSFEPVGVGASTTLTFANNHSFVVYTGVKFKIKTNVTGARILIRFGQTFSAVRKFHIFDVDTEWVTFTKLFDDFAVSNLEGVFDEIQIQGTSGGTDPPYKAELDFLKVFGDYDFATHLEDQTGDTWDWEEADTEGWAHEVGAAATLSQVGGFLKINVTGTDSFMRIGLSVLSINTELFEFIQVKVNASEDMTSTFEVGGTGIAGGGFSIDATQTIYTLDSEVSSDPDWIGIVTTFQMSFGHAFNGNEIIFIDFILLLGEFNPSDSVIGLMDSVGNPLLNISTHFFGNDSARFEFELLDSTGELSYHFYSDLFDDLSQFIIGKAVFDVLRSKLEITLTAENNSRIDKITFPNEFIEDSALTPALFSNEKAPVIFISTHTIDHSWQSLFVDWIKTDFKEKEWSQNDVPSDADWLEDSWDIAHVQDNIQDTSGWSITVPYLDSVSGKFSFKWSNNSAIDDFDNAVVGIGIFAVDSDDGESHSLFTMSIGQFRIDVMGVNWGTQIIISEGGILKQNPNTENTGLPINEFPVVHFSFSLKEERTIASLKVRFFVNGSDTDSFTDFAYEVPIAEVADDPSTEFIISTIYQADFDGDTEWTALFEDFGFIERDIFAEIVDAVVQPIGNFLQQIFTAAFRFLATIFRAIGDIIGFAVLTMQNVVSAAILTMQTALETAVGLVEAAITTLQTALETAIGLVETAIATLEAALETAIGLVETAIETLQSAFEDAIGLVQEAIEGVFVFLIAAMADIFDEIITVLLSILSDIVDVIVGIAFFIWDEIGLPDLLALGGELIVLFGQLIEFLISTLAEVIQLATDLAWVILVGWWIWAIPIQWARANFDPISGIGNFIEVFFYDIFPWNILGFHAYIPQGVVFTLWLILLLPADFAIFTAMS